jgi:hypothetical protein
VGDPSVAWARSARMQMQMVYAHGKAGTKVLEMAAGQPGANAATLSVQLLLELAAAAKLLHCRASKE